MKLSCVPDSRQKSSPLFSSPLSSLSSCGHYRLVLWTGENDMFVWPLIISAAQRNNSQLGQEPLRQEGRKKEREKKEIM